MRRVVWLQSAQDDLARLHDWLGAFERSRPAETIQAIIDAADALAMRDIGRPGQTPGTREFSIRGRPYLLVYKIADDEVMILSVFHTRQHLW